MVGGTAVVVELTDGQRLIGSLGPWDSEELARDAREILRAGADDDAFAVLAPPFVPEDGNTEGTLIEGPLSTQHHASAIDAVPLGAVRRVLFDPWATGLIDERDDGLGSSSESDTIVNDELVFINGDRVSGFLVAIDDAVRFDTGQGERSFSTDRLAVLRLGNPPASAEGPRLWYTNGEIRDGLTKRSNHNTNSTVDRSDSTNPITSSDMIIAGWFTEDERIPLADLEILGVEPGPGRRWTNPPKAGSAWESPLGVADIEFAGPMTVEWRLPTQAASFSAIAALGGSIDRPDAAPGPWANAIVRVTVRTDARGDDNTVENARSTTPPLANVPLDSENVRSAFSCILPGVGDPHRVLVIEVLEAAHGPIQDRILLQRPFLLGH